MSIAANNDYNDLRSALRTARFAWRTGPSASAGFSVRLGPRSTVAALRMRKRLKAMPTWHE
jgi:hypothetical protein